MPFFLAESGMAAAILGGFVTADAERGIYIAIPDAAWGPLFFSRLDGSGIVPGAPSPADVSANGWNAPAPFVASAQLIGLTFGDLVFDRPSVAGGIFTVVSDADDENDMHSTALNVITYENDRLILAHENRALYEHLTGDSTGSGLVVVGGSEAVHDHHVSNAAALLDAVSARVSLP